MGELERQIEKRERKREREKEREREREKERERERETLCRTNFSRKCLFKAPMFEIYGRCNLFLNNSL